MVLFLDSITRLARAHNTQRNSGRTGSGGLEVRALQRPRQLFAAARNIEEAGSLTIIASVLVETGSRMDDVIFQEFKGTGNMELVLDRKCAGCGCGPPSTSPRRAPERRSCSSKPTEANRVFLLRSFLADMPEDEAIAFLLQRMIRTKTEPRVLHDMAEG